MFHHQCDKTEGVTTRTVADGGLPYRQSRSLWAQQCRPSGGKIKNKSGTNWRNQRVALQGVKRSIITKLQQSSKRTSADCSINDAVRWHDRIKQDASCYLPGRFPRWVWTLSPSYALWPGAPSSAAALPSEAPRCQGEKYRVGLHMRTSVMKKKYNKIKRQLIEEWFKDNEMDLSATQYLSKILCCYKMKLHGLKDVNNSQKILFFKSDYQIAAWGKTHKSASVVDVKKRQRFSFCVCPQAPISCWPDLKLWQEYPGQFLHFFVLAFIFFCV